MVPPASLPHGTEHRLLTPRRRTAAQLYSYHPHETICGSVFASPPRPSSSCIENHSKMKWRAVLPVHLLFVIWLSGSSYYLPPFLIRIRFIRRIVRRKGRILFTGSEQPPMLLVGIPPPPFIDFSILIPLFIDFILIVSKCILMRPFFILIDIWRYGFSIQTPMPRERKLPKARLAVVVRSSDAVATLASVRSLRFVTWYGWLRPLAPRVIAKDL